MKRLTPAGSLIISTPRFRNNLEPDGRLFATMSPYAHNTAPGEYQLAGAFDLKYTGNHFYHFGGPNPTSYAIGLVNNMGRVGPSLQPPWLGGKQFNRFWRSQCNYKSATTP